MGQISHYFRFRKSPIISSEKNKNQSASGKASLMVKIGKRNLYAVGDRE